MEQCVILTFIDKIEIIVLVVGVIGRYLRLGHVRLIQGLLNVLSGIHRKDVTYGTELFVLFYFLLKLMESKG